MLDARSMLGFECSVRSMLETLMLGYARARKCSQTGARTRSMLRKSMLDPTLQFLALHSTVYINKKSMVDIC